MLNWLIARLARKPLARALGDDDAAHAVLRELRRRAPAHLRDSRRRVPRPRGMRARLLYRGAALAVLLWRILGEERPDTEVKRILEATLVGLLEGFARSALPRRPAGGATPKTFAAFAGAVRRANRNLTVIQFDYLDLGPDHFGYDVPRCGLAEITRGLGAPEVGAAFCAFDQAFFGDYDPAIRFARTGTLATGAPRCDFRWEWRPEPPRGGG